jgi:hypothetical protein
MRVVGGAFPHPMKIILRYFLIKAIRETCFLINISEINGGCLCPATSLSSGKRSNRTELFLDAKMGA